LAEIADLVDCEWIELKRLQQRAAADAYRFDAAGDVVPGENRMHAGHLPRRGYVDGFDARVRAGAARERRVQGSRRQQIVDEAAGAGDEALGLFSPDALADRRIDGKIHSLDYTLNLPSWQTTLWSSTTIVTRAAMPSRRRLLFIWPRSAP